MGLLKKKEGNKIEELAEYVFVKYAEGCELDLQ